VLLASIAEQNVAGIILKIRILPEKMALVHWSPHCIIGPQCLVNWTPRVGSPHPWGPMNQAWRPVNHHTGAKEKYLLPLPWLNYFDNNRPLETNSGSRELSCVSLPVQT